MFKTWCTKSHLLLTLSHKIWVSEHSSTHQYNKAHSLGSDKEKKAYAEPTGQQIYANALSTAQEFKKIRLNSLTNFLGLFFQSEGAVIFCLSEKCLWACLSAKYCLLKNRQDHLYCGEHWSNYWDTFCYLPYISFRLFRRKLLLKMTYKNHRLLTNRLGHRYLP